MTFEVLQAIRIIYANDTDHYLARIKILNHVLPLTEGYDDYVIECDGDEDKADEKAFADFLFELVAIRNSITDFINSNKYLD